MECEIENTQEPVWIPGEQMPCYRHQQTDDSFTPTGDVALVRGGKGDTFTLLLFTCAVGDGGFDAVFHRGEWIDPGLVPGFVRVVPRKREEHT